jgi:hypothetical protein
MKLRLAGFREWGMGIGVNPRFHEGKLKLDMAYLFSFTTRLELKFKANSESPLKWTENF